MLKMYTLAKALPESSSTTSPTIQYPLVFEVTRDNQCHTLVGTFRDAPLAAFPSELQARFKEHPILLVDALIKLPLSALQEAKLTFDHPNYLISRLKSSKEAFLAEMTAIFKVLGLDCPIENVQPLVLITLWDTLKGTKMVQDFVGMAKAQGMTVSLLKPLSTWLNEIREQIESEYYSEDALCNSLSQMIDEYYEQNGKLHPQVQEQLTNYLTNDIKTNQLPDFMVKQLIPQNVAMAEAFVKQHQQGQGKILMACGFEHLFGDHGLLKKLDEQGFQIRQCKANNTPTPH